MKKYKIIYLLLGARRIEILKAPSKMEAIYKFYTINNGGDIESVEEVDE